jgi:flagellar hook-associated protein 2
VQPGQNASIHVGSVTAGFDVSSATNTFQGVQPGLTFTVSKEGVTSTVSVANDKDAIAGSVSALVDAANAVLTAISAGTAPGTLNSDGSRTGAGALTSDLTIKALTAKVIQAVTGAVGGKSAATYGLQSTSTGTLTFDKAKFTAAYNADPDGTRAVLAPTTGTGVAQRLASVATLVSDPVSGTITSTIASQNSVIKNLNDDIADWDIRLAQRQTNLQTTYTAMEVALQKLQSQASWLSSQLAGLQANSSKS